MKTFREFIIQTNKKSVPKPSGTFPDRPDTRPDLEISNDGKISGLKILDIGCGDGLKVWYLTKRNRVFGFDLSMEVLKSAKRKGIQVILGDIQSPLPFFDKQFDFVLVKDVFEHCFDPLSVLFEAHRVLKSRGTMVVSVPNHFFLTNRLRILFGKDMIWKTPFNDQTPLFEQWNFPHIRFFTWEGFREFLCLAGFKKIEYVWELGEFLYYPESFIFQRIERIKASRKTKGFILKLFAGMFFTIFSRKARRAIARRNPGLLCACFYARCEKK